MKNIKVIVLGRSGMLGSMINIHLTKNTKLFTHSTSRDKRQTRQRNTYYFDALEFIKKPNKYSFLNNYNYLINCIGIIKPYCKDNDKKGIRNAINVNSVFPHKLSKYLKNTKIIQIATDCVFSGDKGNYNEKDPHDPQDVYGKTKSLGEVFYDKHFLNIRCSIIGPELKNKLSLLEWFLKQKTGAEVSGFTHHRWNGVTTLQFAQLCELIITENKFKEIRDIDHIHHFTPNNSINKYELLKIFNNVYNRRLMIHKTKSIGNSIDRTLSSNYNSLQNLYGKSTLKKAIRILQEYPLR